jgi:hypothetical protein
MKKPDVLTACASAAASYGVTLFAPRFSQLRREHPEFGYYRIKAMIEAEIGRALERDEDAAAQDAWMRERDA